MEPGGLYNLFKILCFSSSRYICGVFFINKKLKRKSVQSLKKKIQLKNRPCCTSEQRPVTLTATLVNRMARYTKLDRH